MSYNRLLAGRIISKLVPNRTLGPSAPINPDDKMSLSYAPMPVRAPDRLNLNALLAPMQSFTNIYLLQFKHRCTFNKLSVYCCNI